MQQQSRSGRQQPRVLPSAPIENKYSTNHELQQSKEPRNNFTSLRKKRLRFTSLNPVAHPTQYCADRDMVCKLGKKTERLG